MNNDPRGTMIQQGNTMRINNGFVEDVSCFNNAPAANCATAPVLVALEDWPPVLE